MPHKREELKPALAATSLSERQLGYRPTAQECALLLLLMIVRKEREAGPQLSRFRIAELTLKRLWGRQRINPQFLDEVNDWLLRTGRTLFFAGSTYAVVSVKALDGWPAVSSKSMSSEIRAVMEGKFDIRQIALLPSANGEVDFDEMKFHEV